MPPVGVKRKAESSSNINDDCRDVKFGKSRVMKEEYEHEQDWDKNDKIVQISSKAKKIIGFHLMPTCSPEPQTNEDKRVIFNKFLKDNLLEHFQIHWNENKQFDNEYFEIITKPWKVCILKDLLDDVSVLKDVRQEFYELDWNKRRLDLYNFHQSLDLKHVELKNIKRVYEFFKNDVMKFVGKIMRAELTHVSATCSFYADTDYLLVHDDQREDRVIAFVLYFSDVYEWKESWGGALQLFNHDGNYQPNIVERSIYPKNNQLVLFPVSPISYHQVAEVTNKNFSRYSINGWFHGKINPSNITPIYETVQNKIIGNMLVSDIDLNEFINPMYLDQENIADIQSQIENTSEISLLNYFNDDFYNDVSNALENNELKWKFVGPPNRCHYEILDESSKPEPLQKLLEIFHSEVILRLLKSYTDLELAPRIQYEIQKWSAGCYSLFSDSNTVGEPELELIMYFGCEKVVGGKIQYVDREEEVQSALVTLEHDNNTLNIIYTDTDRINNYINKYTQKPFYVLMCKYNENSIK